MIGLVLFSVVVLAAMLGLMFAALNAQFGRRK